MKKDILSQNIRMGFWLFLGRNKPEYVFKETRESNQGKGNKGRIRRKEIRRKRHVEQVTDRKWGRKLQYFAAEWGFQLS